MLDKNFKPSPDYLTVKNYNLYLIVSAYVHHKMTRKNKPQTNGTSTPRVAAQGGAMRPSPRPGAGTLGRPIQISANHFALQSKIATVYHYDIDIKPETSKALFK